MNVNTTTDAAFNTADQQGPNRSGKAEMGKQDFMKLLIFQMSQQDPLDPQDSAEFASQLAQFTSLERLVNIEEGMGMVALSNASTNSTLAVGFIGKQVRIQGDTFSYDGVGQTDLGYNLDKAATEVQIKVKNSDGKVIQTLDSSGDAGANSLAWDGKTNDGNQAPAGKYTFVVVRAVDAEGNDVAANTETIGTVKAINFKNGYPELVLENGEKVSMASVIEVLDGKSSNKKNESPIREADK